MAESEQTAYVGLGSNLGDRVGHLAGALRLLRSSPGIRVADLSPVYETEPWGYTQQPPFLNAVAKLATVLGPRQLLLALKSIEGKMGREQTFRWGPRVVDLDLLLYGDVHLSRRGLELPHPGLLERAFVLVPLRDVHPDFRGPDGTPVGALISRLGAAGIRRFSAEHPVAAECEGPQR
mgnify:CR=1 FL=1